MIKRLALAALLAAFALVGPLRGARAEELNIGDPAPKLEVKEFVKGTPVMGFEKGKTYVVEFWATWCGPCIATIPHLTELQKKYKDVQFVGVSVWENDQAKVKPFVTKMAEKMDYTVAMDSVPVGADGNQGSMAKNWMTAAAQNGIPTAFVINGDSKIAWVGHPMELEKPLAAVVAGTWDVDKAATEFKEKAARDRKMQQLQQDFIEARKAGDPKKAIGILDAAITEDPKMEMTLGFTKYATLLSSDPAGADAYGKRLVEVVYKDDAGNLNAIAWNIIDPAAKKKPTKEQIALALAAAKRAEVLTEGKDPAIGDTLAKAYYDSGDVKMALATQEKALANAKGTPMATDKDMLARLAMYKAAVKK